MATPAEHTLFDNVEEMLAPPSLSHLLGTPTTVVRLTTLESNGFSTNQLSYVQADDQRLVLKRLSSDDWMARGSRDDKCRSMAVWRMGLLDRAEPHLRHGVIAGSRDGTNYALLMRDCSEGLRRWGGPDTSHRLDRVLKALASMHSRFWDDDTLTNAALELADVETLLVLCWPRSWPLIDNHPATVALLQTGWQALLDLVEPDARTIIEQLLTDPGPLVRALQSEPITLLHGDYRPDNVAVMDDRSVMAFDWQLAGRGPGVMDLAWLVLCGDLFTFENWAFDRYRDYLSDALNGDLDVPRWQRALSIGKLAEVLRKGNWHALFAVQGHPQEQSRYRQLVSHYNDIVRQGVAAL